MTDIMIGLSLWDFDTDEEIEGINFPWLATAVRAGETIHYWQDGLPEAPYHFTDTGISRDFLVVKVTHDLRYMPARNNNIGRSHYVHTVMAYVREVTEK